MAAPSSEALAPVTGVTGGGLSRTTVATTIMGNHAIAFTQEEWTLQAWFEMKEAAN
jgi:hypothetical protein